MGAYLRPKTNSAIGLAVCLREMDTMTYKIETSLLIVLALTVFTSGLGYGHSGGTDGDGGHYNRKTGEYHSHVSPRLMSYPLLDFSQDSAYRVLKVIDGDTVKIQYEDEPTRVRLIGVDTPEMATSDKPAERFEKEASSFTHNLLTGESIYLRFNANNKRDKYGRLLAYVYRCPDGLFVNLETIRQGYGRAYTRFPFKYSELFRYYEQRAREGIKGI